ncbi:TRAF3-interacting protein 1 isoform X2 [Rhipicephalus sanguineus]|uniref:TRAF3-interacting protein 1 isoform X2 n=1 Tax=Rhipicephalus sanguineus TaxID=34632 RepID=UPI0020C4939F|nr:TRAF3-interacting protein 1 isoform X2 [Rhipicephalus sanguineus]
MDEEVSAKVIKKTQDLLGSVIKKPPLQEKLLKKPPFRFLHDVIHNVIKATSFLDGLYNQDELTSENIKDKESKIAFLQKAIDAVGIVSGSALPVRPSKIVAGHEPDKTNEFLQVLAKLAAKKVDSSDAVKRVLTGEKPPAPSKPEKKDTGKKKEPVKVSKKSDGERKSRKIASETDPSKDKKSTSSVQKEKSSSSSKSSKLDKTSGEHRSKSREPDARKTAHAAPEGDDVQQTGSERPKTSSKKKSSKEVKEPAATAPSALPNGISKLEQDQVVAKVDKTDLQPQAVNPNIQDDEAEVKRPRSTKRSSHKEQIPESSSEGHQDKLPTSNSNHEMTLQADHLLAPPEPENKTVQEVERPLSRSTLRSSRPRSSRPAAPRIRKRENSADSTPAIRAPTAKPVENVILDTSEDKNEDDKDDEFVITESTIEPVLAKLNTPEAEHLPESEQGNLVKQILEAKKELEQGSQRPSTGFTTAEHVMPGIVSKAPGQDKMDALRQHIQAVSRGALPLGKLLDLLSEDLDSMNMELSSWKEEHTKNLQAYSSEQSATDSILEPLRQNLEELDQRIGDELEEISATRAAIFSNAEHLEKMLAAANLGR